MRTDSRISAKLTRKATKKQNRGSRPVSTTTVENHPGVRPALAGPAASIIALNLLVTRQCQTSPRGAGHMVHTTARWCLPDCRAPVPAARLPPRGAYVRAADPGPGIGLSPVYAAMRAGSPTATVPVDRTCA